MGLRDDIKSLTTKEGLKAIYHASLYRNAVYLMLNSGATAAFGFVFWILTARLYPAESVGLASAALALISFLVTLTNLGMDYGLVRYIPEANGKRNSMVNSCLTVAALATLVISMVYLTGVKIWSPELVFLRKNLLYFSISAILMIAFALYVLLNSVFVAHKKAGFTLVQTLVQGFVRIGLVIFLPLVFSTYGIFISWGIGLAIAVLIGTIFIVPHLQADYRPIPTIQKSVISKIARFSFVNYVAGLITKVPTFILPLMVTHILGAEQNAYFYIAYAVISNVLLLIPAGISLSLFAEGSHDQNALGTYVKKSLKFSFLILIPLIILVLFFGDKILLLFGNEYSQEATKLLWILAISSLPLTINTIYLHFMRVRKRMFNVIVLSIITTVIILCLTYYILLSTGIIGVGIGWLTGHGVVTLVIVTILLKKKKHSSRVNY